MASVFAPGVLLAPALLVFCACSSSGAARTRDAGPSTAGVVGHPDAAVSNGGSGGGAGGMAVPAAGGHTTMDAGPSQPDAAPVKPPPFMGPDAAYVPKPGSCGFDAPAFCDTFEDGPEAGGRAGELDDALWSAVRGGPWEHPSLDEAFRIGPAILPPCRAGLDDHVLPDSDVVICDPVPTVPTRHLMTATAAQNYGLNAYRIRRPFDFAGRTGSIKLDVCLLNNGLGGWPAVVISQDPSSAPSFDWEERGSGPRNGVELEFNGGWCNTPHTVEMGLFTFRDYVQTAARPSFDCATPHVTSAPDSLNHVEIYLTEKHLEVWASDASPDGKTFPGFQKIYESDLDLPFSRGYVSLVVRNHATMKYWVGSAWAVRWDNVGFDGPVVPGDREYSVPDSLTAYRGIDGCKIGGECRFRGDFIRSNPDDGSMCGPDANCTFDGEGRNVGYVVPNPDETPVKLVIPGVRVAGATRARLVFAATYPWFDWNGVSKPPTAIDLRYRLNGGAFHDRFVTSVEANAFTDFSPDLGGAGHGAGLLNQVVDVDPEELVDGDNTLELVSEGTWTGSYRIGVTGVDLLLGSAP